MDHKLQFFINGAWVPPTTSARRPIVDPATESVIGEVALGGAADIDMAVRAARAAFATFGRSTVAERLALLRRVIAVYETRLDDLGAAISSEMGAPAGFAHHVQATIGVEHLRRTAEALEATVAAVPRGTTLVVREPVGVAGLITPWNWPMNQITCKVGPALAAGCTMVLKPSELTPTCAVIFTEILHEAGAPAGVFNLVNGNGSEAGQALAAHPDVDMISFTGSTRAGIQVAKVAADTVKRVHQELGGKSANIILPDADFALAVAKGVELCFGNSGQSCNAPTRMLVPADRHAEALVIAKATAEAMTVGPPSAPGTRLGPVVSQTQYARIQALIEKGIAEGANLVTGGLGLPAGLSKGYYVRPTVFGHVRSGMTIAREEIFGPVLSILSYADEEDAIALANDSVYGLAAYVQSTDIGHARAVAARLRVGTVHLNYPAWDPTAPFGGYKQSGNGREYADFGLNDFLEIKGIVGYGGEM